MKKVTAGNFFERSPMFDAVEVVRDGKVTQIIEGVKPAKDGEEVDAGKDSFLQILGRIEGHLSTIENLYPQECGGYCDLMKQDVEALKLAHNVMQYEMSIERSKGDEPQTD